MGIISDLIFAIIPTYFVLSLKRPFVDRILVFLLMVLGIIAAVAGVMKVYYIKYWNPRQASLRSWMPLFWWYRVEEMGLITASCALFLKPPMEGLLRQIGLFRMGFDSNRLKTVESGKGEVAKTISSVHVQERGGEQISSDSFDHPSNGPRRKAETDYEEV